uniref:PAS domain S-box protein n=1 Tax=Aliarcobacter sp. TaxID=2321116 RepID=UPI004047D15B
LTAHEKILDYFEFLVWVKDANGIFLDVNEKFAIATGLNDVNLIIGKTDFDIWPYELALNYKNDDEFVMNSKVPKKVIEKVFDHEIKWFETFKKPIFDDLGNVIGTFGYAIDLSDKVNFQKELEEVNEKLSIESSKLKTLINAIPDLVWVKDINGAYLACNSRFEQLYGHKEEEILTKTDYDFVDYKTAEFFRLHDKNAMNANKPITNFELLEFAIDGHKEYTKTTKTKVLDNAGNIIGILGIGRDFTSEHLANEKLEFQKEELQTIFDTTKDGIAIIDLETNFKKVNKAYCSITGLSEEELLNTSCLALTIPEDMEGTLSKLKILFEKGHVDSYEKRCVIKGRHITVSLSVSLLPDKQHMLVSMKDMSQFKLFEEQSKLAAMGEMIGNIAHQWRQPLSVITSISTGIKMRSENNLLDDYNIVYDMDMITKQAQYLSKTIDDFRNFIRNSEEKVDFSIKNSLKTTISILHSTMINNHINLILNFIDDLTLNGIENELIQAFINIINNARDAINENVKNDEDKFIFIKTQLIKNKLEISIKDSAGGIEEHIIHRIFEPYFTTKHKSVGTGIGLSMAYKIVTERYHGTIMAENEEYEYNNKRYKGACFKIVFN